METIRSTKLFESLKKEFDKNGFENLLQVLFEAEYYCDTPTFYGGLDHIEVTKKGFYFYDIGVNYRANSFVIRPNLK